MPIRIVCVHLPRARHGKERGKQHRNSMQNDKVRRWTHATYNNTTYKQIWRIRFDNMISYLAQSIIEGIIDRISWWFLSRGTHSKQCLQSLHILTGDIAIHIIILPHSRCRSILLHPRSCRSRLYFFFLFFRVTTTIKTRTKIRRWRTQYLHNDTRIGWSTSLITSLFVLLEIDVHFTLAVLMLECGKLLIGRGHSVLWMEVSTVDGDTVCFDVQEYDIRACVWVPGWWFVCKVYNDLSNRGTWKRDGRDI